MPTNYVYDANVVISTIFDAEDSDSQDLLGTSVLDWVLGNTTPNISPRYAPNLSGSIVKTFTNNYATKVEKYYKNGRDEHPDWIPSNIISNVAQGDTDFNLPHPDIQGILDAYAGEPVNAQWYFYGLPRAILVGNSLLEATPEYDVHSRNNLLIDKARFTRLSDGKVFIVTLYEFLGTIIKIIAKETVWVVPPRESPLLPRWIIRNNAEEIIITSDISLSPLYYTFNSDDIMHQVMYYTVSTRDYGYWYYDEDTNLYPSIHGSSIATAPEDSAGSYPFTMLVEDGKNIEEGGLGQEYLDATNSLLGEIDLSVSKLMEALNQENPDNPNQNPLEDVKDACVLFAANFSNDTDGTKQYIYQHFNDYYNRMWSYIDVSQDAWVTDPDFFHKHVMMFTNNRIRFSITVRWIRMRVKTGLVTNVTGPIPSDTDPNSELRTMHSYVDNNGVIDPNNTGDTYYSNGVKINEITIEMFGGTETGMTESHPHSKNTHQLIIRKQLTETTYVEQLVFGLSHVTYVTNYNIDGTNAGRDAVYVINTLDTNNPDMDPNKIFIPLAYNTMQVFNPILKSKIFYESLSVLIHTFTATHIPWYANKKLMSYLRVFLFILTWGTSEIWVQGLWEILKQLVINYAVQILITQTVNLLVDLIGGEIALIIAAIAAVYALTSGKDSTDNLFGLLGAEQLMYGATSLIGAVNQEVVDDFLELQERAEAHEDYLESEQDRLDAINAQISKGIDINLLSTLTRQPIINSYENPDDFYNRSVHITNPGVLSLDTIDSYTTGLLKLPEFKPTN